MSIKEDFIKFINERKHAKQIHQQERELKRDKRKAQEILDKFSFSVVGKYKGKEISRLIQEHNFEYCFFPAIWNSLDKAHKMAVMVKFSQKHTPNFPLTLDDFFVQKSFENDEVPCINYNPIAERMFVGYNSPRININSDVLTDLLMYEEKAKQDIFKDKVKKGMDLSELKGVWQLRYFFENNEHELMAGYPEIMADKSIDVNEVRNALKWDSVSMQYAYRLDHKLLEVFERVNYFMPDFPEIVDRFKGYVDAYYSIYKESAEKFFGTTEERDLKFLESFNEKCLRGNYDVKELAKTFTPGKRPELDEDPFDNIELTKGMGLTF